MTDEQLKALGWDGMISSIQELAETERSGLNVFLDILSDQMAALCMDHGVPAPEVIQMGEIQAQAFQALLNLGRLEQQVQMLTDLHGFIQKVKGDAETGAAESA
jgi:hypothetical protein